MTNETKSNLKYWRDFYKDMYMFEKEKSKMYKHFYESAMRGWDRALRHWAYTAIAQAILFVIVFTMIGVTQ